MLPDPQMQTVAKTLDGCMPSTAHLQHGDVIEARIDPLFGPRPVCNAKKPQAKHAIALDRAAMSQT